MGKPFDKGESKMYMEKEHVMLSTVRDAEVKTWSARMPAYCFTALCPDPTLRDAGNIKNIADKYPILIRRKGRIR